MDTDENIGDGKKIFKIAVRFVDGEDGGEPRERMIGFSVEAGTLEEAKKTLRRWLGKCLEQLNGESAGK